LKSVPPVVPVGVSISEGIDSDWMEKDLRCIKDEMKKLKAKVKSVDISASTPSVNASVLQGLRDEIAYAKGIVEDAKATGNEAKKESGEVKDTASEAVQTVIPVGVSVSEGIGPDWMKKDLRCIKYEMRKLTGRRRKRLSPCSRSCFTS
jgi:hypothetical protein